MIGISDQFRIVIIEDGFRLIKRYMVLTFICQGFAFVPNELKLAHIIIFDAVQGDCQVNVSDEVFT
jgi:hypothetical protein